MKHLVFQYNDKKSTKNALKEVQKSSFKAQLLQVFTSLHSKKKISLLIQDLEKKFPNAIIIGTTTAGEIAHAKMLENSTVLSLSLFQKTKIKASYIKHIDYNAGIQLASKICSKQTKSAIILSEGLKGKEYENFLQGFNANNADIIVAGGLAGDNFKLNKTFVFLNGKVYTKGSVAVSFSSKSLYVNNSYNLNWTPIGKEFTITKANGTRVEEINNQKSVDFFATYLGEDIFRNNAKSLPDFQLLCKDETTLISRTPMAIDGDALIFAAPLKEGQKVQFGFSNAASVISASKNIGKNLKQNPAEAIFIYSCIARKSLLGKVLENEFLHFESVASTAGFFTYGEYYSTSKNNALLNCTTTLLVMSESKKSQKKSQKNIQSSHVNLEDTTFNALTHFIEQTSNELNANREILNQYKAAVDASLIVSKTDKNGFITYVNDNFCRTSQYTREELIGHNHNIIRDKNVSSSLFKKLWTTIENGKIWHGQFSNRAKDGSLYYVQATIMPAYKSNKFDGYIAIRQDVTKQILANNKMKEKEKFIKAIFDNQDNIVILASKSKGILSVNKTFFEYFNFLNLDDFTSKHKCSCELFLEEDGYIHPKTHPDWLDIIVENPTIDYKVKMKVKDNSVRIFNIKINKVNDQYILNLSDITNLENALKKAHSSEQAKTMFLANMSHEIRTPLNGILGFTEILKNQDLEKSTKKYIDIIDKSGKSLLNIVNDILDYSKIESGQLALFVTNSNLFSEMESVISTFASAAKTKEIDFITHIDTKIPKMLRCDVQRIRQVMSNLLSNAIKFTPQCGLVHVEISLESLNDIEAKIRFSVQDSGIGISENKIDSVFQAFSQADNSISRKFGGTGLGLSISSTYIEMMHSQLQVKSKEGEGSEFYFTLDLEIVNKEKSIQESHYTKKISIMKKKNLNNCDMTGMVKIYLDGWSYDYDVIETIEELQEDTEVLIVSTNYLDKDKVMILLEENPELNLICLETGQEPCSCYHHKFHPIEQPMVGSSLFDILNVISNDQSESFSCDLKQDNLYNGNVLVAEDNETNQMLISIMLDERGLEYKIVENGQLAIEEAEKNNYDIIFMDINMPILDGLSAIKILRENNYTKPIVSLSANVIESDIKKYQEAGVNDTLHKPIVVKELDTILHKYLIEEKDLKEQSFDVLDLKSLSRSLSLLNEVTIIKLLKSFQTFAQESIENISKGNLDTKLLHSIKGTSGNLRFDHLYNLSMEYEMTFPQWNEDEKIHNSQELIVHLQNLIDQIDQLD